MMLLYVDYLKTDKVRYCLYASKKKANIPKTQTVNVTISLKSHLKGQNDKYDTKIPKRRAP